VVVAAASCWAQDYQPVYQTVVSEEQLAPPRYAFEYSVHDEESKDIHSHKESRDGDKTEGEYSLVEPDGAVRTVKYHVDGNSGFIAEVFRSGQVIQAVPVSVAKPILVAKPVLAVAKPVYAAPLHVPAAIYQPQYVVPTPGAYVAQRARSFNPAPVTYNQRSSSEEATITTTEPQLENATDDPFRA
jgi:hypothetical protein